MRHDRDTLGGGGTLVGTFGSCGSATVCGPAVRRGGFLQITVTDAVHGALARGWRRW